MTCKKVCEQYPQDQLKSPIITGTWQLYISEQEDVDGDVVYTNKSRSEKITTQNNLLFTRETSEHRTGRLGVLYPVGKCWEAKSADNRDTGTSTYYITKIVNGVITRMREIYIEPKNDVTDPKQNLEVSIVNWYRID